MIRDGNQETRIKRNMFCFCNAIMFRGKNKDAAHVAENPPFPPLTPFDDSRQQRLTRRYPLVVGPPSDKACSETCFKDGTLLLPIIIIDAPPFPKSQPCRLRFRPAICTLRATSRGLVVGIKICRFRPDCNIECKLDFIFAAAFVFRAMNISLAQSKFNPLFKNLAGCSHGLMYASSPNNQKTIKNPQSQQQPSVNTLSRSSPPPQKIKVHDKVTRFSELEKRCKPSFLLRH